MPTLTGDLNVVVRLDQSSLMALAVMLMAVIAFYFVAQKFFQKL